VLIHGLAYTFDIKQVAPNIAAPVVVWSAEQVNITADEALRASRSGSNTSQARAVLWPRTALARGPRLAAELKAEAEAAGFTDKQLRAAYDKLGVRTSKGTGKGAGWRWSLPDADGISKQDDPAVLVQPIREREYTLSTTIGGASWACMGSKAGKGPWASWACSRQMGTSCNMPKVPTLLRCPRCPKLAGLPQLPASWPPFDRKIRRALAPQADVRRQWLADLAAGSHRPSKALVARAASHRKPRFYAHFCAFWCMLARAGLIPGCI
jgi:hypothetical protein